MIEIVIRYDEETERACFDLLDRSRGWITPEEFRIKFKKGIENGEIYIERENGRVVSYLKGDFQTVNGFKFFNLKVVASLKNYLDFCKEVRKGIKEIIKYVIYYRKKSNSIYLVEFLNDDKMKFKRIMKGVNLCGRILE